jgi:hypothetical protein
VFEEVEGGGVDAEAEEMAVEEVVTDELKPVMWNGELYWKIVGSGSRLILSA